MQFMPAWLVGVLEILPPGQVKPIEAEPFKRPVRRADF